MPNKTKAIVAIRSVVVSSLIYVVTLHGGAAFAGNIEDIKADIAADPNNADLYFELALEYENIKDWRAAADAYIMAIGLDPGDANLHFRLAEVYLADDELGTAIDSYRRALGLDENLIRARYQMGRAQLGLRRWDEAVKTFEEYVAASPYDYNGLWYLGQAYEMVGRKKDALEQYKKILDYSTGAFASAGEIGVFGTSDDLEKYIRKLEKNVYGE
ncbi:MAG: tetratricopeptide repeat protein [Candidatus Zixiibacteriota bacterium]|jgi:tetratricopeptide (TPR) repeat protein